MSNHKVSIGQVDSYQKKEIKQTLCEMFATLGMDPDNPFRDLVHPGDSVFIKPNWVASRWRVSCTHKDTLYSVITHPVVIEAMVDFVAQALEGEGKILIGDNPSIDADFDELMEFTGIKKLEQQYAVPCEILDLRPLVCEDLKYYGKRDKMVLHAGDPAGEVEVNLGTQSLLAQMNPNRFRGVFDEREETVAAHTGENQIYTYSASLYNADVYISIPKLKTHQKVGATLNLKGLVGTVAKKNQLVHWSVGYPEVGGDEYPDQKSYEEGQLAKVKHRGAWPGNDTIWRMVADLYAGFQRKPRRYFSVVDGIVAGEGQGPFCPTSKYANTLIGGADLLDVDLTAAKWMGLMPDKIKYLAYCMRQYNRSLEEIEVFVDGIAQKDFFAREKNYKNFRVTSPWESAKSGT